MFDSDQYSLLDFGDGRKLEKFRDVVLDRPSPAAEHVKKGDPQQWQAAAARYRRATGSKAAQGKWSATDLPATWTVQHSLATFELKVTDFGHVGLFVEQAENWDWIAKQTGRHDRKLKVS